MKRARIAFLRWRIAATREALATHAAYAKPEFVSNCVHQITDYERAIAALTT